MNPLSDENATVTTFKSVVRECAQRASVPVDAHAKRDIKDVLYVSLLSKREARKGVRSDAMKASANSVGRRLRERLNVNHAVWSASTGCGG